MGLLQAAGEMEHHAFSRDRHEEGAAARCVRQRDLVHLGAAAQHPPRECGIVGIGLAGDDTVCHCSERVGEEALVRADIDRGSAAGDQLGKNGELGLPGAQLIADAAAVEPRRRHQHGELFAKRERHRRDRGLGRRNRGPQQPKRARKSNRPRPVPVSASISQREEHRRNGSHRKRARQKKCPQRAGTSM